MPATRITQRRTDTIESAGPVASPAAPEQIEPALAPLQISTQRLQSIGVKLGKVERTQVADQILTNGNVAVDETRVAYVQVRFSGFVQRVFVDATYQSIHRGQPLFSIYSPELVSTEREFLLAVANQRQLSHSSDPTVAADAASLVDAAAKRLEQWDVPAREIARIKSTGQVRQDLEIDSPVSGYVIDRQALPNKYAQPDTRLYTVADLSSIWVFAQVFQNDLGRLRWGCGDDHCRYVPGPHSRACGFHLPRDRHGHPHGACASRVPKSRPRADARHVRQCLARRPDGRHEVIPAGGVLQTGARAIAFVDRGGGSLEPRDVELGERVGDRYIVLKGLHAGETIVTSANFLIDSESQIQAALGTFVPPPPGATVAGATDASQADIELATDPNPPRKGGNLIRVRLRDRRGAPLAGAQVTVTFNMAAMPAMGMAAMRVPVFLTDRGSGLYEGKGQLRSGGTWQVAVVAEKNQQLLASKQLSVNATGGR